jgi:hypothetical protein
MIEVKCTNAQFAAVLTVDPAPFAVTPGLVTVLDASFLIAAKVWVAGIPGLVFVIEGGFPLASIVSAAPGFNPAVVSDIG